MRVFFGYGGETFDFGIRQRKRCLIIRSEVNCKQENRLPFGSLIRREAVLTT